MDVCRRCGLYQPSIHSNIADASSFRVDQYGGRSSPPGWERIETCWVSTAVLPVRLRRGGQGRLLSAAGTPRPEVSSEARRAAAAAPAVAEPVEAGGAAAPQSRRASPDTYLLPIAMSACVLPRLRQRDSVSCVHASPAASQRVRQTQTEGRVRPTHRQRHAHKLHPPHPGISR